MGEVPPFKIEFFEDENGHKPALEWIKNDLDVEQRRIIGLAMNEILQHEGANVCSDEWGKNLGGGLCEFRVRQTTEEILKRSRTPQARRRAALGLIKSVVKKKVVLRVFFHQDGDTLLIVLSGYDKGRFPSSRRQQQEIEQARKYLRQWRARKKSRS